MSEIHDMHSIETWLADIRAHITTTEPSILPLYSVYEAEARYGRQFIDADLSSLPEGAVILEVGAGSLLLSCQLVREGFSVSSLEPIADGFSHFERLRELVLERAKELGCLPQMIHLHVENLSIKNFFDFAFSINVMEHISDIPLALLNIGNSLRFSAKYHFICANYAFPYEPHFNIPIFFSKTLTEKVFRKTIIKKSTLPNPSRIWRSINWITTRQVLKIIKETPEFSVSFNRRIAVSMMERIKSDNEFAKRRSKWVVMCIELLMKLRLHYLAFLMPTSVQPLIDCTITRLSYTGDD